MTAEPVVKLPALGAKNPQDELSIEKGNGGVDAPACEPSKWGPHDAPYAQPVTPGTDRLVCGYIGTHDVTGGVNFAVPVTRLVSAKWED